MHLLMSYIASVGNLYGDAGIKHLLHESGVFAAGTVNQMLAGKDFDRILRGLYLINEVMHDRLLSNFLAWCSRREEAVSEEAKQALEDLATYIGLGTDSLPPFRKAAAVIESEILPF